MTCGIYAIVSKVDGKRYVGKSIDIEKRWTTHLSDLRRSTRKKDTNRHLFNSFRKYGEFNFGFEYLEITEENDTLLKEKELFWISTLRTNEREFGFNLRLDSDTKCIVSDETRKIISEQVKGEKNPNYGRRWTDDQKKAASELAIKNHQDGKYSSPETKQKYSETSKRFWSDNPEAKEKMRKKVSEARTTYKIAQYTLDSVLIKVWDSMYDILESNPDYFRIAIYNCCNGHKKSYRGFLWKKIV